MNNGFIIKFDDYQADKHAISMRQLGLSLVGFESVISTGLRTISTGRLPKKRERFPLVVNAREPVSGSFEIYGDLAPGLAMLPLAHEAIVDGGASIVWRWLSWIFMMEGGRTKEADPHFLGLLELTKDLNASKDLNDERQRQFLLAVLDRLHRPAAQALAPVGPSTDSVSIGVAGTTHMTTVDVPMADAVRSKDKIEVGDMQKMRVRVDGFIHHNRQLKVENPEQSGSYLTAHVRDPLFDQTPNVYTTAAADQGWIDATVKPSFKDGQMIGLYIMDAEPVRDGTA